MLPLPTVKQDETIQHARDDSHHRIGPEKRPRAGSDDDRAEALARYSFFLLPKCRVLVSSIGLDAFASSCTSSEQVGLLFADDRSWVALAESS